MAGDLSNLCRTFLGRSPFTMQLSLVEYSRWISNLNKITARDLYESIIGQEMEEKGQKFSLVQLKMIEAIKRFKGSKW